MMRKLRFIAAPLAAAAVTVAGAGVAGASPLTGIANGVGTGMGVGGSLGQVAEMSLDLSDDFEGVGGVAGKLVGGSVGVLAALPEILEDMEDAPEPEFPAPPES